MTAACQLRTLLLAAAAALVAAPSAKAGFLFPDPVGDTYSGTGHDIISYQAVSNGGGSVVFSIEFASTIAAPSAFAPNSVLGFIDIDRDLNAATGGNAPWGANVPGGNGNSWINYFSSLGAGPTPVLLGDEFYIDLGSELIHPGLVDVVRTSDNTVVGSVGITYGATTLSLTVDTSLLGSGSSIYNYGILVGDFNAPSDQAPNGPLPAQVTPAPSGLVLLTIGAVSLLGGAGLRRWRRGPALAVCPA